MPGKGFSRRIEEVLALAALDADFRKLLLTEREKAIDSCEIRLKPGERAILLSVTDERLMAAIDGIRVPDEARRAFLAGSVRSALTLILGVAVIGGLLSAISIGNLVDSPEAAREASAISRLRTIYSAQELYKQENGCYAQSLQHLKVDRALASGVIGGYKFEFAESTADSYQMDAIPENPKLRFFRITEDGVIYQAQGDRNFTTTLGSRPD